MNINTSPAFAYLRAATHGLNLKETASQGAGLVVEMGGQPGQEVRPQPVVSYGASTKNYFKNQISQAQAQAAQYLLMIQSNPGMGPAGMNAAVADLRANIANYTKAMAGAPDKPGMFVMYG